MTPDKRAWVRRRAWDLRFERYGPSGRKPVPAYRRKPSARAKRIADQEVVARITRETMGDGA